MGLVLGIVQASGWEGLVSACCQVELGYIPQVGRAIISVVFRGDYELSMALGTWSAHGLGCVPFLMNV